MIFSVFDKLLDRGYECCMEISSEISNKITRALRQSAYGIVPGFLDPAMVTDLSRDIDTLEKEQMFKGAAVGRGQEKQEADLIRRDRTCWLDSVATTPLFTQSTKRVIFTVATTTFLETIIPESSHPFSILMKTGAPPTAEN